MCWSVLKILLLKIYGWAEVRKRGKSPRWQSGSLGVCFDSHIMLCWMKSQTNEFHLFINNSCWKWGSLEGEEIIIKNTTSIIFISFEICSNPTQEKSLSPSSRYLVLPIAWAVWTFFIGASFFLSFSSLCLYNYHCNVGIWHCNNIFHFKRNTAFCTALPAWVQSVSSEQMFVAVTKGL